MIVTGRRFDTTRRRSSSLSLMDPISFEVVSTKDIFSFEWTVMCFLKEDVLRGNDKKTKECECEGVRRSEV